MLALAVSRHRRRHFKEFNGVEVGDRLKGANALLAVLSAQREQLINGAKAAGLSVDGGFFDELAASLSKVRDVMVEADSAHEAELSDDPLARDARDTSADTVVSRLVELREVLTGLYGAAIAQQILAGDTPRDPMTLTRVAAEVAERLRVTELPTPRLGGAVEVEGLATALDALRVDLEGHLRTVAEEGRKAQATLAAKNEAMATYDNTFRGVGKTLEGFFLLGGQPDLAARVRPSRRAPGRPQVHEDDPEPPTPAPADS